MSTSASENPEAALPPMALLAALQTAWTVGSGIRERRAGRDPAAQEPDEDARAYLRQAARELTRLHMQLLMAKVQATRRSTESAESDSAGESSGAQPPARLAATVRRFDVLMKLRRVERLLHGAHQRLMSLYPHVSEELVEEARQCRGELAALQGEADLFGEEDAGEGSEALALFLQRLLSFAAWMEREL